MSLDNVNLPIDLIRDPDSVTAAGGPGDLLDKSKSAQGIANILLKESKNYTSDSQAKFQKAQQYLQTSKDLEQLARAVRDKARTLKNKQASEEEKAKSMKEIISSLPQELTIFVPPNSSPEVLERIADELMTKAKDFRTKADDLLKDSETSDKLGKQLREQAHLLDKKEISLSDLQFKAASAHNEGLLLTLKKLGIAKLDAEYKEQVSQGTSS